MITRSVSTVLLSLTILALSPTFMFAQSADNGAAEGRDAAQSGAVSWRIDATHSFIGFKVRHMGIASVTGEFKEYEADITLDPADLSTLSATAVVHTASIDTDNERRDNHLRSDDFFNAEQFPEMRFESRVVRLTGENTFEIVGDLTIRETTREIVLTGEFGGTVPSRGGQRMALSAEGRLNRFDYGLRWDSLTEAGGLIVGEEVRLVLDVAASSR